ncbi:MAG: condensation domain-containing protein, partial [Planctomycetota bacterium]
MASAAEENLSEQLATLSPAKRAALEAMLLARGGERAGAGRIPRRAADTPAPLSFAEQRLWLLDRLEPEHPFYNMPLAARLTGPLDTKAFAYALEQLAARHETLRYAYAEQAGEPVRTIHNAVRLAPRLVDLRSEPNPEDALQRAMRSESRRPFELSRPPLLRCVIYKLAGTRHVVLLVMHHIVSDGWSMGVMLSELTALYDAALRGPCAASPLAPLPLQYSDFAAWQRGQLDGAPIQQQLNYWRRRLADTPPALELPTDCPRPPVQDYEGGAVPLALGESLSSRLRAFAEQRGVTPFTVLMAAYQAWLCRHTGADDLCVGAVVANRTRAELERLIGFFVNTQAIRIDLSDDPEFSRLLDRVQQRAIEAQQNQDVPFDQVMEAVAPERDRSHDALFQAAMVVQNAPHDLPQSHGLRAEPLPIDNGTAKYDLTFFFWEEAATGQAGRWVGRIEFRTALFERATVERFAKTFQTLLGDALDHPSRRVSRLALLDAEHRGLIDAWGQNPQPTPGPRLVHECVERWMRDTPAAAAVIEAGQTFSYAELDARSAATAAGLWAAGVAAGDAVVVCLPRSAAMLAAMLGVWRAGGVYVPVDAELTAQRLAFVAADCGARVVIAGPSTNPPAGCTRLTPTELTAPRPATPNATKDQPAAGTPTRAPGSRAYVIYTSGSTGKAKGVACEHAGI